MHWKSSSLTKCAVDAVIASIKCFCIVPIMRFSGPTSCNNSVYFYTRLNCPPSTQCPYETLDWVCPFQGLRVLCGEGMYKWKEIIVKCPDDSRPWVYKKAEINNLKEFSPFYQQIIINFSHFSWPRVEFPILMSLSLFYATSLDNTKC